MENRKKSQLNLENDVLENNTTSNVDPIDTPFWAISNDDYYKMINKWLTRINDIGTSGVYNQVIDKYFLKLKSRR